MDHHQGIYLFERLDERTPTKRLRFVNCICILKPTPRNLQVRQIFPFQFIYFVAEFDSMFQQKHIETASIVENLLDIQLLPRRTLWRS